MRSSSQIKKSSKLIGRPPAYNRDEVIEGALRVFHRKGFASTSLDDLVEATGVNRPSLYIGFGNKEQIYLLALDRFRESIAVKLGAALRSRGKSDSAANAVKRYFNQIVKIYTGNSTQALGCAVFCTAVAETANHNVIRDKLAENIEFLDKVFETFLLKAREAGKLQSKVDCVDTAQLLIAAQHSLALRARAGQSRNKLQKLVDATVRLVG